MLTILIAVLFSTACSYGVWYLSGSLILGIITALGLVIGINLLIGRFFLKKLNLVMSNIEKDLKSERYELALEKLKSLYPYAKWQIFLKSTIDSQIGSIFYVRKKFTEAKPYLEKSSKRNWMALCMLACQYYREKNYDKAYSVMDSAIAYNKKEAFVYSLYAYFLNEQGKVDKAIEVMNKAEIKLPIDERIASQLQSLKNNKKIKMQNYGTLWLQMHLGKMPDGVKQYQTFIANQKIRRR